MPLPDLLAFYSYTNTASAAVRHALFDQAIPADRYHIGWLETVPTDTLANTALVDEHAFPGPIDLARAHVGARTIRRLTMLREPTARFVSEFNYVHGAFHIRQRLDGAITPAEPDLALGAGDPRLADGSRTLDDWIALMATTGYGSLVEWLLRWSGLGGSGDAPAFVKSADWFERLTGWIDLAFADVMIAELIEESLFLLTRAAGWANPGPWARLRYYRPTVNGETALTPDQTARIAEVTAPDRRLYDHYRARFDATLSSLALDDPFLRYKAAAIASDRRLNIAFKRRDYRYLSANLVQDRKAMAKLITLVVAAQKAL